MSGTALLQLVQLLGSGIAPEFFLPLLSSNFYQLPLIFSVSRYLSHSSSIVGTAHDICTDGSAL